MAGQNRATLVEYMDGTDPDDLLFCVPSAGKILEAAYLNINPERAFEEIFPNYLEDLYTQNNKARTTCSCGCK